MKSEKALQRLIEGNIRYIEAPSEHQFDRSLKLKQEPFAVILGCSDSRAPPELIFDEGFGNLFVVRVAGSVAGDLEIDSIHFAVNVLKCSLVVVLGHQNCGAVEAVVQGCADEIPHVGSKIKDALPEGIKDVDRAVRLNAAKTAVELSQNPNIAIPVVSAFYCFETGKVTFYELEG